MSKTDIEEAILANPDVKAVFVNNPTYYGICGDLKGIVEIAHRHGVKVLVDEAHGTHFYFGDDLPISAMAAGADMAAVSMHKTGGSLTQSSFLLIKDKDATSYVRSILNLTHTTSGSYLLLASLDIARKHLALEGKVVFKKVSDLTRYAREEIRKVVGYIPFDEQLINGDTIFNVDPTKLSIFTRDIGLTGIEIADILRDEYDIQIEFGDLGNILAIISVGDTALKVERLLGALTDIKRKYAKDPAGMLTQEYIQPKVVKTPREAFYTPSVTVSLDDAIGKVSAESVMAYPPGIPICAPGELITKEIVEMIHYAKSKGSFITGPKDTSIATIDVLED
jgi:lysine decarboxylase